MRMLLTGTTGYFGRHLLDWLRSDGKVRIGGITRDEHHITEFDILYPEVEMYLGDVRNREDILDIVHRFQPDVVIHAAALKVVPHSELHPDQYIRTNVIGTQNVVDATLDYSSYTGSWTHLVYISTDKACEPHNVYGITKRLAEKLVLQARHTACRFGNIMGSTGSVPHIWRQQYITGRPLTVVEEDMTRFFMAPEDMVKFAFEHIGHTGLYVPKLKAYTLQDFLLAWIRTLPDLSLPEERDLDTVDIAWMPPRDGEKLHEALVGQEEAQFSNDLGSEILVTTYATGLDKYKETGYSSDVAERMTIDELDKALEGFWEDNPLWNGGV